MSTITSLPTPPSRQDPSNFNDRADAFLGALPTFVTETNTVAAEVNSSANAVIAATNVTKWISGNTYNQGAVVWSPINGLGYRRITASGSGTTDPSLDPTNYKQVNGTGDVSTSGNQTISGVKVFNDNLGLGVTPSAWYTGGQGIDFSTGGSVFGSGQALTITANSYINSGATGNVYRGTGYATQYVQQLGQHQWYTAPSGTAGNPISFTQAMTLDASGNLLVGTTNADPTLNRVNGTVLDPNGRLKLRAASGYVSDFGLSSTSGPHINFWTDSGSTRVAAGSIVSNGSSTSYNTSSDYRLKHDIAPMQNALQRVAALKPVTYKWNADNSDGEGFIAHELAEVCPQAVTGEKDAVDEDGKPAYQGIDTSFLVATLTAAIQEQQVIINQLKARLDAANL